MSEKEVYEVGRAVNDETGEASVTLSVPVERLEALHLPPELATGAWSTRPASGMGNRYGLSDQAQKLPQTREDEIVLARDIYYTEPLVHTVINMLVDMMMTGMENRSEDLTSKEFFDKICKYGNFDELHRSIFKELLVTNDAFILRSPQRVVGWGEDTNTPYFDYTVMNTRYVTVDGPLSFGLERIGINPTDEMTKSAEDAKLKKLLTQFPNDFRRAITKKETFYPKPETVSRISRGRQPYERYATPDLSAIFEPVLLKRRMRQADLAIVESVRNVLVTITIGDKDFPANDAHLTRLAELFSSPSKTMELFWNHTLNVEYHYPNSDLFNTDKYNQVNRDILQGLGVSTVLIDGDGGTMATAWTSMLSVMERLESIRRSVGRWQEQEYIRIAQVLGADNIKRVPSVSFKPLNLRDDKVFKNMLLEMFDRHLISASTLTEFVGLDFLVEAKRLEEDKKVAPDIGKKPPADKGGRPGDQVDPGNYTQRGPEDPPQGPPESDSTAQ